jgi:predicted ribosomally synthesized peptide with nif11-like leader
MSRSQLQAFVTKLDADPALRARVDAATDTAAIVAIALEEGHLFSSASWTRHLRG